MNSNEIEKKLERDNLTIKEQILNLQNTIKKLKQDMLSSKESKQSKEDDKKFQKVISNTHENDNIIEDENEREKERQLELKFSFNKTFQQNKNKY